MEDFVTTHKKAIENDRVYNAYKDKRIIFSQSVTKTLGLKQKETVVTIGMEKRKAAIISATMDDMVILANLNELMQKKIYSSKGMVLLHLKFYDSLFKEEIVFNLFTKFLNMNNDGLNHRDMHYVNLQFLRRIPNDLIHVFGKYHEKIKTVTALKNNKTEGMLFARGIKQVCFPSRINESSILLNCFVNPTPYLNQKAMVVLKCVDTGDVFEIIGRIDEQYSKLNESFQIKLNYSLQQQSPRFSYSYKILKNAINY